MDLEMANQQGGNNVMRDYRKGNWTVQETMVLIEAKKMDEERRMKRIVQSEGGSSEGMRMGNKPGELRWKWVEDYCWRNGCLRSQNQCNDKWDNLMRDFKKVRDYESRLENDQENKSYWKLEKSERKDQNLPSNMLPQIYEALVEVLEKKGQRVVFGSGGGGIGGGGGVGGRGGSLSPNVNIVGTNILGQVERPSCSMVQASPLSPQLQHYISPVVLMPLQSPQQPTAPPPPPLSLPYPQPLPISDSDTSEHSNSSAKRRKRGEGASNAPTTTTTGATDSAAAANIEVGSAISRSASLIAGAIQASEEKEERRHKELLSMHEKRLQIEESKAEINRQGINGLVDAINKLAHSVLALASSSTKNPPTTPK